jgi:peptide/nickel transport system substrate-binding protein
LKEPYIPYLIAWQTMSPIPQHIFAQEPDMNSSKYNTQPIGSGPFKFVSRVPGDSITVQAFADYFGPGPYLDQFIIKVVPQEIVQYERLKTGEFQVLSYTGIPPDRVPEAQSLPELNVYPTPSSGVEWIYFNCRHPILKDKQVRQALYLAMDKDTWINKLRYGLVKRTLSYLPPSHWAYNTSLIDPGYDPKKAAALLDAAGWTIGPDGIRTKDGVKLSFTNSANTGQQLRAQAQQLIQANLKAIGVDTQIKNMDASVVFGEYMTKSQFETLMLAWEPPLYPDPDYSLRIHSKQIPSDRGTGSNYIQYANSEVDQLLDQGLKEFDQNKRKRIYWQLQKILLDDLPFAPIFNSQFYFRYQFRGAKL